MNNIIFYLEISQKISETLQYYKSITTNDQRSG